MSGVDWLRDEPLSRLSAITTVLGLGLTFIAPHCAVRCVTFPLGWDKPVTEGLTDSSSESQCLLSLLFPPPLHTLFLSPNMGKPLPAIDPISHEAQIPGCFNVDFDVFVSLLLFAIFVAQQVTRSHFLCCRLMEYPCGKAPFCRGTSDLIL